MRISLLPIALTLGTIAVATPAAAQVTQVLTPGALSTAGGPLTTHNFETSAGGPGATYSYNNGTPRQGHSSTFSGGVTTSGVFGLTSTNFPSVLTIVFEQAVGSVGMFFGNDDLCCSGVFTAFLEAYNSAGLIGSVGVVANMNDFVDQFLGLNSTVPVSFVRVRYGSGSDVQLFNFVDDVSFAAAVTTVPEPSSLALVATGLLGVIGVARRRRA